MADDNEVELTTDEEILSNVQGLDEESATTTDTKTEDAGSTDTTSTTSTDTTTSDDVKKGADGKPKVTQTASPQDLVGKDGNVIAASGRERRFYETAQREKTRADNVTRERDQYKTQVDAFEKAGSVGTQYNLTPDEVVTGAQLISSYKTDPVATIKYLLTQAQASGHNIDTLGGGSTDMASIKQLIESTISPLLADRQAAQDTQVANSRALETYNNFISQYPDAPVHEKSIARLLTQDPNLTPEAAYFKLQNYYLQKQLDWTKPLEVLIEQSKQVPQTSTVNTQQALPDGNNVNGNDVTDTKLVADVDTSFDQIIRDSMKEAGITS